MKIPTRIPTVTERATAIELALTLIEAATHTPDGVTDRTLAHAIRRVAQEADGADGLPANRCLAEHAEKALVVEIEVDESRWLSPVVKPIAIRVWTEADVDIRQNHRTCEIHLRGAGRHDDWVREWVEDPIRLRRRDRVCPW